MTHLIQRIICPANRPASNSRTLCRPFSAIKCRDGFTMSVQAGQYNYCLTRTDDPDSGWTHFEVDFPSEHVEALMPYAEDTCRPTHTVYGNVPAAVIDQIIADHGGLADGDKRAAS